VKIALYIEDGLEQIVLTPESDTERAILAKLHDGTRALSIKKGSFYECRGGYIRYTPHEQFTAYGTERGDDSTLIVLRVQASNPAPEEVYDLGQPGIDP